MKQLVPRKYDRNQFLVDVEVRSLQGGGQFPAHALDLCASGVGLFANRYLGVGQPVELVFPNSRGQRATDGGPILGWVANARIETDGNILGIAFARPLADVEMQSLRQALGVNSSP